MARILFRQVICGCSSRMFLSSCNRNYDLVIANLDKEMESIFGEPPLQSSPHGKLPSTCAIDTKSTAQEHLVISSSNECKQDQSHVDNRRKAWMADVSLKESKEQSRPANLIHLCHSISLTHVDVDHVLHEDDFSIEIVGEALTTSKTGVEMEAMTAIARLTVYDMGKAVTKEIQITNVCLEHET